MIKLRHILLGILIYAVMTVWVRERWALSGLQAAVFLCSAACLFRIAWRKQQAAFGIVPILLAGVCLWGLLQLVEHWTVVASDTNDAVLYWLAAACFAWLGNQACAACEDRDRFLKGALLAGSVICLAGIVQLFTSEGKVFWLFASGYSDAVIGPFVNRNLYACFVELLLPVALLLAFKDRRNAKAYLIVAAALVASVVASASRAGTMIVVAEVALVFLLQRRAGSAAGPWVTMAVLASAFSVILGYQLVCDRFLNDADPLLLRREFVQSSLAMIRAQPLHGFGLGAWPSAYKAFAMIDTGAVANHAHNEWIQWAAEGGLPVFAVMAAIFVLSLPAALRSVWGLGIVAVFLHALIDYPFLRPGLAAWIFVWVGALAGFRQERRAVDRSPLPPPRATRWATPALCGALVSVLACGIYLTVKLAWADVLYRRATPESVARAAGLCPLVATYQFAQAKTDPEHAVPHLERALALNPYLTRARIELAAELEFRGDLHASEAVLLEASRRDKQYAPAWAIANFYFRQNQPQPFWSWARTAAERAYGDTGPLLDLCFHLTDDALTVLDRVVVPKLLVEQRYLAYLASHESLVNSDQAALRIARQARSTDRQALLDYVDQSLAAGRFASAFDIWNELCRGRLLPYGTGSAGALANGDFAQPILNRGFDWNLASAAGVTAMRLGDPALQIRFSGSQPEQFDIMSHFVPLVKNTGYILRFQYRTLDLPPQTGLFWSLAGQQQPPLAAAEDWSSAEWRFQASADTARLVFAYRRCPGTTRGEGKLLLRKIELKSASL